MPAGRRAALTLLAHSCARLQGFGYAVSLAGFGWYQKIKLEPQKPAEYASLPSHETAKASA